MPFYPAATMCRHGKWEYVGRYGETGDFCGNGIGNCAGTEGESAWQCAPPVAYGFVMSLHYKPAQRAAKVMVDGQQSLWCAAANPQPNSSLANPCLPRPAMFARFNQKSWAGMTSCH